MAAKIAKELGAEFLNCAVCRGTYKEPKMLPCIHSFCKSCLEECVKASQRQGNRFGCPICRTSITLPPGGITALPTNFLLQSLHDKLGEMETEDNSDQNSQVKTKHSSRISKTRCSKHTNSLSMYCRTCKSFQCMTCTSSREHMGHDLVDATDGELDVHDTLQLQAVLLEAVQERSRCRGTEEKARKALQRIKREAAETEESIKQRAAEARERIEAEETSLLSRLHMTEARKLRLLNRVLDGAKENRTRCKEIEGSVKEALLSEDSDETSATGSIASHLDELRTNLRDLDLDESLLSLGLEFHRDPSDNDTIVGELRNATENNEQTNQISRQSSQVEIDHNSDASVDMSPVQTLPIHQFELSQANQEGVDHNVDGNIPEVQASPNSQSFAPTLEQSIDALLNEAVSGATPGQESTMAQACSCTNHLDVFPPPPPWRHPPHHPPHHPRHHHPPHFSFGPRRGCHHHGMRPRHPFFRGRGRRGHCHQPM